MSGCMTSTLVHSNKSHIRLFCIYACILIPARSNPLNAAGLAWATCKQASAHAELSLSCEASPPTSRPSHPAAISSAPGSGPPSIIRSLIGLIAPVAAARETMRATAIRPACHEEKAGEDIALGHEEEENKLGTNCLGGCLIDHNIHTQIDQTPSPHL